MNDVFRRRGPGDRLVPARDQRADSRTDAHRVEATRTRRSTSCAAGNRRRSRSSATCRERITTSATAPATKAQACSPGSWPSSTGCCRRSVRLRPLKFETPTPAAEALFRRKPQGHARALSRRARMRFRPDGCDLANTDFDTGQAERARRVPARRRDLRRAARSARASGSSNSRHAGACGANILAFYDRADQPAPVRKERQAELRNPQAA